MGYSFWLPWPDKALSPNARGHWSKRAQAVKAARRLSFLTLRQALPTLRVPDAWLVDLEFVFVPPDRRRYDDDGLAARMKSARDGIADFLQVDDNRFRQRHRISPVPTPGGQVIVKLRFFPAQETPEDSEA